MILIEIPEKNYKKYFPESLAECDSREYKEICRWIYLYQAGKISLHQFRTAAVYSILDIQPSKKLSEEDSTKIFQNIALLSDYVMNFFHKDEEGNLEIKQYYWMNPIPKFNYKGFGFYGPTNLLEESTFGQYVDGLTLFLDYGKNQEFETLVKLLQIYYKPKIKFVKLKKDVDLGIVYGFYLFFASFQKFISTARLQYGGIDYDLSIIFADDGESYGEKNVPGLGMKSILFSISESGVFGTKEDVRKTDLLEVIFRLYDLRKKTLDEKAEFEKMKKNQK